jgi:hypothetical protein
MQLATHPTCKMLNRRLKICGYEVLDLLGIILLSLVLNLAFGTSSLNFYLVWLPIIFVSIFIKWFKRGKPDNYLLHLLRFQFLPGVLQSFQRAENAQGAFFYLKRRDK